jgi:hypothetical protein
MAEIVRTKKEIDEVLDKVSAANSNGSEYPGMTYEQGIEAMWMWLTGETDDNPFE